MPDINDLLDQIEDMNEAGDEVRWRHKKEIKELIVEFQKFLRVLHDHTFNPLKAQENLNWIRYEIEKRLKNDE